MPCATAADWKTVGPRLVTIAAAIALAAVAAASAPGAGRQIPNWAAPQIATVVSHKLMGAKRVRTFKPNRVLQQQTLADLAYGLQQEVGSPTSSSSASGSAGTTTDDTTT